MLRQMLRQILRYTLTLIGLQVVLGGIVFLTSDYRWVAIATALCFLGSVAWAGRSFAADMEQTSAGASLPQSTPDRAKAGRTALVGVGALAVGLLWQLPGLHGTIRFITDSVGWTAYDGITDLQDFLMETWHTALLPLLGAVTTGQVLHYYARYYILLVAASPLLILLFGGAALLQAIRLSRTPVHK